MAKNLKDTAGYKEKGQPQKEAEQEGRGKWKPKGFEGSSITYADEKPSMSGMDVLNDYEVNVGSSLDSATRHVPEISPSDAPIFGYAEAESSIWDQEVEEQKRLDAEIDSWTLRGSAGESYESVNAKALKTRGIVSKGGAEFYEHLDEQVPEGDLPAIAYDYFLAQGHSPAIAAGLVGNIKAEGGFRDDVIKGKRRGDSGTAAGIVQWRGSRQRDFERIVGKPIGQASFVEQLGFVDWELKNTERTAYGKIKSAATPSEAAALIDKHYERSAGLHRTERMNFASNYFNQFSQRPVKMASTEINQGAL